MTSGDGGGSSLHSNRRRSRPQSLHHRSPCRTRSHRPHRPCSAASPSSPYLRHWRSTPRQQPHRRPDLRLSAPPTHHPRQQPHRRPTLRLLAPPTHHPRRQHHRRPHRSSTGSSRPMESEATYVYKPPKGTWLLLWSPSWSPPRPFLLHRPAATAPAAPLTHHPRQQPHRRPTQRLLVPPTHHPRRQHHRRPHRSSTGSSSPMPPATSPRLSSPR